MKKKWIVVEFIVIFLLAAAVGWGTLTKLRTFVDGNILTAAHLNDEFANIYENPLALISPLTGSLNCAGYSFNNIGDLLDENDNEVLAFTATSDAVNHSTFINATTGNDPIIQGSGDDDNVGLILKPKGTGTITIFDSNNGEILRTGYVASAENDVTITNAADGNAPSISATGDDTNIGLKIMTKGDSQLLAAIAGYAGKRRGVIEYSNDENIIIPPNLIDCCGKLCYWTTNLTFITGDDGDGGSNSANSSRAASKLFYVALDNNTITSGTALTAANFICVVEDAAEPTWSTSYGCWVMDNAATDRVIGVLHFDSLADIDDFTWDKHSGRYHYNDTGTVQGVVVVSAATSAAYASCSADLAKYLPKMGDILCSFGWYVNIAATTGTNAVKAYLRTYGSTTEYLFGIEADAGGVAANINSSGYIELIANTRLIEYKTIGTTDLTVWFTGFYLEI